MKKVKSILVSALTALIILASFGVGIMFVGFAIVIGGAFALAIRLGASDLQDKMKAQAEAQAKDAPIDGEGVAA